MLSLIFLVLFLLSNIFAIFYMLKVRHIGAQNPSVADGLTVGERILVFVTMFFGGIIIAGSIFYYGWKKQFPKKVRSVLHIEWGYLVVFFIAYGVLWYWDVNYYQPRQQQAAQEQAQIMLNQYLQQTQQNAQQ